MQDIITALQSVSCHAGGYRLVTDYEGDLASEGDGRHDLLR